MSGNMEHLPEARDGASGHDTMVSLQQNQKLLVLTGLRVPITTSSLSMEKCHAQFVAISSGWAWAAYRTSFHRDRELSGMP